MTSLLILAGLVLLFIGGEATLRGAIGLSHWLDIPRLVVGLVIIGFGTSLPELAVSVDATARGEPGLAVGNVIGSNISNCLLILAAAALVRPIVRPARILLPDGITLLLASAVVVLLGFQGAIPGWQGLVMIAVLAGLVVAEYLRARKESKLKRFHTPPVPLAEEVPTRPLVSLLLAVVGLVALVYGAELLVDGVSRFAEYLGVSPGLIGLTLVALGSSVPELVSALLASWRGQSELAYGNIIGSNLFNLLGILGAASLAGTLTFPLVMVWLDGTVMLLAAAIVVGFLASGSGLGRSEALVMLATYLAYVMGRYMFALDLI